MSMHRIRKFLVASVLAGALVTTTAPYALASTGCHDNDNHGRSNTLGEGGHGVFLPNGVLPLGCIPGSITRPCQGPH